MAFRSLHSVNAHYILSNSNSPTVIVHMPHSGQFKPLNVYVIPSLITNQDVTLRTTYFYASAVPKCSFFPYMETGCRKLSSSHSQRKCLSHEYDYRSACSVLAVACLWVLPYHLLTLQAHKPDFSGACAYSAWCYKVWNV